MLMILLCIENLKPIGSVELIIAGRYIRDPITCTKPILDNMVLKLASLLSAITLEEGSDELARNKDTT